MTRTTWLVACAYILAACSFGEPSASTPTTAPPARVVLVTIGSNETVDRDPDGREQLSWPRALFRDSLPTQGVLVDLARDGSTVAEARDSQLEAALRLRPTLATVWLVTDDAREQVAIDVYKQDLSAVVMELRASGAMVAVTAGFDADADDLTMYAAVVRAVASDTGAALVDLTGIDPEAPDATGQVARAFAKVLVSG